MKDMVEVNQFATQFMSISEEPPYYSVSPSPFSVSEKEDCNIIKIKGTL